MVNNLDYMLFLLPIVMGCGMIFRAYKAEIVRYPADILYDRTPCPAL